MSRIFYHALLIAEVHEDDAEALVVSLGPFEVIEQALGMVAADAGAVDQRPRHGADVAAIKADAALVGDATALVGTIAVAAAVLGDLHGQVVLAREPHEQVVQAVGPNHQEAKECSWNWNPHQQVLYTKTAGRSPHGFC
jgi:hypothetical protein